MVVILFLLQTLFCSADTLQNIQASKVLRIGLQQGYIPFNMRKANGDWLGFEIEMMREFGKSLGATLKVEETKWEGIIPSLITKKFDAIAYGLTITEDRAKAVLFSEPYFDAGLKVLVSQQNTPKLEDLDDPKMTIGVQIGTTGDFYASKHFKKAKLMKMDMEYDAANSVLLKKLNAFIGDGPYIQVYSKRHKEKVKTLPQTLSDEKLGVAFRKQDQSLAVAFNNFLKEWKKSGAYEKTRKDYFETLVWLKDFPHID